MAALSQPNPLTGPAAERHSWGSPMTRRGAATGTTSGEFSHGLSPGLLNNFKLTSNFTGFFKKPHSVQPRQHVVKFESKIPLICTNRSYFSFSPHTHVCIS